jgi:pimeloyl-ACP methyl ester carboxylesterase
VSGTCPTRPQGETSHESSNGWRSAEWRRVANRATHAAVAQFHNASMSVVREKSEPVSRTRPDAERMPVRLISVSMDVSSVAPAGCKRIAADLFVPQSVVPMPLLWVCIPGGGINRQYFDLDVASQSGAFSMARHLAAYGDLVVTVDPPGVGGSDVPDDGYTLTSRVVAEVLAAALDGLRAELARDGFAAAEVSGVVPRAVVGLGHSAGALLVAVQQAYHHSYDVVALLGFSASGLPDVLNENELRYAGRPEQFSADVKNLAKARFGSALPEWSNTSTGELEPGAVARQVETALAAASSRLLALVGMTAIVPGSVQPELDELRVPIFAALGEHDLGGTLDVLPRQLPACADLTLFLLEGAGHNHNVAVNRQLLWDRVVRWAISVTS